MTARSLHFKVGNGDMTLFVLENGRRILVDCNIRAMNGDNGEEIPDVAAQLRVELLRDAEGRLYVDAFLLTHPDQDHCRGLRDHFHLGPLSEWSKKTDKVVIRELWSSPIIFRRASKNHALCDDAEAWATEARRRVALYRTQGSLGDADRILILGEDVNGKTDDVGGIVVKIDSEIVGVCGVREGQFAAKLLAPLPPADNEEEDVLSKNNSSVVMNLAIHADGIANAAKYLLGGDAEVAIWERLWSRNKNKAHVFQYDLLIPPHHCSWHSLSWDSWSDQGEDAKVSPDARGALSQTRPGAMVLSSSKAILDDDNDPPCIRAKREYEDIASKAKGEFVCLADMKGDGPYKIDITAGGAKPKATKKMATVYAAPLATGLGTHPLKHG
jgi:hypothetical protein